MCCESNHKIVQLIRARQSCVDVSIIKSCNVNKEFISSKQYGIMQKLSTRINNIKPKLYGKALV